MTSNDSSPLQQQQQQQQTNNDDKNEKNQQQQQQQQEPLLLSMELTKPLGLILEEVQENQPMGVKVQELSKEGSAYAKEEYRNVLVGMKLSQVMDVNVSNMSFENVMDCIIQAPSPLRLSFVPLLSNKDGVEEMDVDVKDDGMFPVGTTVEIRVLQSDKEDKVLQAKVGDNLRKVLLDNQVELYRGLKKKLGNCGGGGQCTFCAVDFVQEEGWGVRSEYETQKIGKKLSQTARLACLNNVQGPATIRVE